MSITNILYNITIYPLELVFETLFACIINFVDNLGVAIIFLSVAFNIIVLPLYIRADSIQKEERDIEKKLKYWEKHIKSTFKGDERFMMLQAFYRVNNYKPTYVLRSIIPLVLQVPFFIAAYRFLSELQMLKGASFGAISDLGTPDAMLNLSGVAVNVLPIIMTLINILSGSIYTRGSSIKSKLQVYGIAFIFLVFLYGAPSGLVLYWTLNNVFSLLKNIIYKFTIRKPKLKKGSLRTEPFLESSTSKFIFALGSIYNAILTGALIPSAIIRSSPTEFIDIVNILNPNIYIWNVLCIATGLFVLWFGIYFELADNKKKAVFSILIWLICVMSTIDYMFFGTKLGTLSSNLQYIELPMYSMKEILINSIVLSLVVFLGIYVIRKHTPIVITVMSIFVLISMGMTIYNMVDISKAYYEMINQSKDLDETPKVYLSKGKKNVIVIMMDRMVSEYIPYIMEEDKLLYKQFDGFTFYPNTVSYGTCTNAGSPGLFGGYEYVPDMMNKRSSELLVDKHNEALKVMPVIFDNNGYNVTVCDPSLAGYEWIPDIRIYDEYPEIHKYITEGVVKYDNIEYENKLKLSLWHDFFMHSIFKISPVFAQKTLYDEGKYFSLSDDIGNQVRYSISEAEGISNEFMKSYNVLDNLNNITEIDKERPCFCMMTNHTTHEPTLLQMPEYIPKQYVNNTEYGDEQFIKYDKMGNSVVLDNELKINTYCINMSAMKKLGDWFDYLREQGIYNNTRIIIVSDHAFNLFTDSRFTVNDYKDYIMDLFFFNCTLIVKDFGASGFKIDHEFMTNADVPTIATKRLIDNPINPFTKKIITNSDKYNKKLELLVNDIDETRWNTNTNNGYTFLPAPYYSVHDDIFDPDNWEYLGFY